MKTLLTSFSLGFLLSRRPRRWRRHPPTTPQAVGTSGAAASADAAATAKVHRVARLQAGARRQAARRGLQGRAAVAELQVRPDGKITLPLVGDMPAAGQTPTELRDAIVTSLKEYITNPTVTVIVVETVPPVIYVTGEVNSAGPQSLTGKVDVIQALATAKGLTDFANRKDILIRRGSQLIKFNYNDAVKGNAAPVYLQPGDTIIVR